MVVPDVMNVDFLPQGRHPEHFVVICQLDVRSVSGRGGQEGGYLEDIEGS